MNKLAVSALGIATVGVAVLIPTAAFASTGHHAVHCYDQGAEHITVAHREGDVVVSDDNMVTNGSPCRDVNVRAAGSTVTLRLRWGGDSGTRTSGWVTVRPGHGWRVASYGAHEGDVYSIEIQGWTTAAVSVRS